MNPMRQTSSKTQIPISPPAAAAPDDALRMPRALISLCAATARSCATLAILLALGCTSAVKTPAPGRPPADGAAASGASTAAEETASAHAPGDGGPSARSLGPNRPLRKRASYYVRRNARPESGRRCGSPSTPLDAGGRRSARAGSLRRAHGLQRHPPVQEDGDRELPRADRDALRPRRERLHDLRRDGLHAQDPHRRSGHDRDLVPDPRGLGEHRDVRGRGDRQGAGRRRRGMALGAGGGCPYARQAVPDPLQGFALCRAADDRKEGGPRDRPARRDPPLLPRLVPARSHGRHRGGRFRPRPDREDDPGSLSLPSGAEEERARASSSQSPARCNASFPVATDPEATTTRASVYYKLPRRGRAARSPTTGGCSSRGSTTPCSTSGWTS